WKANHLLPKSESIRSSMESVYGPERSTGDRQDSYDGSRSEGKRRLFRVGENREKMFRQTLSGAARNWFDDLDPKSMDNFEELSQKFLEEFSQQKSYAKDLTEIHGIKRRMDEGLKEPGEEAVKGSSEGIWERAPLTQEGTQANRRGHCIRKADPLGERYTQRQPEKWKLRTRGHESYKHGKDRNEEPQIGGFDHLFDDQVLDGQRSHYNENQQRSSMGMHTDRENAEFLEGSAMASA
ncbi:reverse transcriptase domain-containing protein, partial [Tanacetum coccineum]